MQQRLKQLLIVALLLISGLLGFIISFYNQASPVPQEQRHQIQTFHYPATFVKQLAGDKQAGKKIFKEFCASCHAQKPLIDIQAPHIGDHVVWGALKKVGLAQLVQVTVQGAGAMPARGGCFECSDEQLQETIRYILKHSES
jgi:cytochrome c5